MHIPSSPARLVALRFDDPDLLDALETATSEEIEHADFGIVAMAPDGEVLLYNRYEAELSGLDPLRVVGRSFFRSVAPCMIRGRISERFQRNQELDELVEFVLTLRVKPTPVVLRLLKSGRSRRQYLAIRRSG